jgi:hypothetical protein
MAALLVVGRWPFCRAFYLVFPVPLDIPTSQHSNSYHVHLITRFQSLSAPFPHATHSHTPPSHTLYVFVYLPFYFSCAFSIPILCLLLPTLKGQSHQILDDILRLENYADTFCRAVYVNLYFFNLEFLRYLRNIW